MKATPLHPSKHEDQNIGERLYRPSSPFDGINTLQQMEDSGLGPFIGLSSAGEDASSLPGRVLCPVPGRQKKGDLEATVLGWRDSQQARDTRPGL